MVLSVQIVWLMKEFFHVIHDSVGHEDGVTTVMDERKSYVLTQIISAQNKLYVTAAFVTVAASLLLLGNS